MTFNIFSSNKRAVNLIVKDHVIRYIEIKQQRSPIVNKFGERYLPEGVIREGKIIDRELLVTILEECIEEWGIKKRPVRFLVPDPYIVIRKIEVPGELTDDEIRGHLYLELGASIHLPFEEPAFDVVKVGEKNNQKELLLFAAPEQLVSDYAGLLEEVKLVPLVADISPLSIYRLYFQLDQAKTNDHLLVVQADLQMVNISIFHEHRPIFMRHLTVDHPISDWNVAENDSKESELKWTGNESELHNQYEDIYKEIERIMNFYRFSLNQGKEQITTILLSGDHPLLVDILATMKDRFEVPVVMIDGEQIITVDGNKLKPTYYLALGLAQKEV